MRKPLAQLRRALFGAPVDPRIAEVEYRAHQFKSLSLEADSARDAREWTRAAGLYEAALALDPDHAGIRVQYGHALKEAGRLVEAETAYRLAATSRPLEADAYLQLGHVLKVQGRMGAAIEAYAEALKRDPGLTAARNELIAAGARENLPGEARGRSAVASRLARLSANLDAVLDEVRDGATSSAFPISAFDAFRRQYPVKPAPPSPQAIALVIDAAGAAPSDVRLTLSSLLDQRVQTWSALVVGQDELTDHPVASLAKFDARIRFIGQNPSALDATLIAIAAPIALVPAGAILDPEAVGWFASALERTGATALYADHEHYEQHWRTGLVRSVPVMQSMADPYDLASSPHPPATIVVAQQLKDLLREQLHTADSAAERRRRLALDAMTAGRVAHIPQFLTALPLDDDPSPALSPHARPTTGASLRILMIIPTRDEPEMLEICVATMRARAARPDLLDVLVVDNRSVQPETEALLNRLRDDGQIDYLRIDEPFNWARLNNVATEGRSQDIFIFANNDTEMLSSDWDDRVRAWLSKSDVGAMGARLLYPDGGLQHGGILLGACDRRPVHDGLDADALEGGPLERWRRSRAAAAVTGAFMACRRDTFRSVGGFDPLLAIAYNDIDFCLRVRQAGLTVLYAADIELLHYESRTRGLNDDVEKVQWDESELSDMHKRWRDALFLDPGLSPHWASAVKRPYDGYRDIPFTQILTHIDQSARRQPWSLSPT